MPGLSEYGIAAIKTAEALGIRMARADVPETVRPSFGNYSKVIEYCRTLAGHREVEEFHVLYLDRKNRLIADRLHQRGTVCHTPAYPGRSASVVWSFRRARSSPYTITPRETRSPPGRTST